MLEYRKSGKRSSGAGLQGLGQMWRANPIGQLERRIEEWSGWEKTEKWEMVAKRIIYIVGFVCLVLIDAIMGSETGGVRHGMKNYTGVVLGLVILTAYRLKDFLKLPYLLWTVIFFIGRAEILQWVEVNYWEHMVLRVNTALWAAGVYGLVVIRMLYLYIAEREKPKMNWPMFAVWLFTMVWMVVVQPETTWQLSILLYFAPFYLTNFKEKDLNNLYTGLAEGIIIGFLMVQGWALMHRPYDTMDFRYAGANSNCNINALFYCGVYSAVLCKWYQMKLRRRHVLLRIPIILLTGVVVSLTVFTGGRSALITEVLLTLIFLVFQALARKRGKILEFLLDGVILCGVILLCFEPTFKLVRYLPAIVDEPVYVDGENIETKIQQGDPIDDEKYVDFEEMLEENFGRILWFLESEEKTEDAVSQVGVLQREPAKAEFNLLWLLGPSLKVEAANRSIKVPEEWYEVYWYPEDTMFMEPGCDSRHPILLPEEYNDYVKIRMAIWQYYFMELNLTGVHEETEGPWITRYFQAIHTHNFFLQMAYEFGWLVGVLLIFLSIQLYNKALFGIGERKSGAWYYRLFVTLSYATVMVAFGMLEMSWVFGYLSFTMFFLVQYVLYHKNDVSKKAIESR